MATPLKAMKQLRWLTPAIVVLTLVCTLTGVVTLVLGVTQAYQELMVLLHLVGGVALSVVSLPFLYRHFQRTVGFRRTAVLFSGWCSAAGLITLIFFGWWMLWYGQQESAVWHYRLHVVGALVFVAVTILHVVLHLATLPATRRKIEESRLPSLPQSTTMLSAVTLLFVSLVGAIVYPLNNDRSGARRSLPTVNAVVANYSYNYGDNPFYPSETTTASGSFVAPHQIAESDRCVACHKDIGEQWMSSMHRHAASDPAYVKNINLLVKSKGIAAARYCEGCHAPVALLTGQLSEGGQHGGVTGTIANQEGVSCLSCHAVSAVKHLKGNGSYVITPATERLFQGTDAPLLSAVSQLSTRTHTKQHKAQMGRPVLKTPDMCATCHAQFMDEVMNDWGWVKMQDEYTAWLDSPFSGHSETGQQQADPQRCQDCHMPLVASTDPSASRDGLVRSHRFAAANTFVPHVTGDEAQLREVTRFLQANKIRIKIDEPRRELAQRSSRALKPSARHNGDQPYYFYLGERVSLTVVVTNQGVGHNFPGGTTDLNEAWIEFVVTDAMGDVVYESGALDENNSVDKKAYFYRSVPIDKRGHHVWKHDLFNMVGESFSRVLKPGEADLKEYDFSIPGWVQSPLTVAAKVRYRKLNDTYANWVLDSEDANLPIVDVTWDSLQIPVRNRKEVVSWRPATE